MTGRKLWLQKESFTSRKRARALSLITVMCTVLRMGICAAKCLFRQFVFLRGGTSTRETYFIVASFEYK